MLRYRCRRSMWAEKACSKFVYRCSLTRFLCIFPPCSPRCCPILCTFPHHLNACNRQIPPHLHGNLPDLFRLVHGSNIPSPKVMAFGVRRGLWDGTGDVTSHRLWLTTSHLCLPMSHPFSSLRSGFD